MLLHNIIKHQLFELAVGYDKLDDLDDGFVLRLHEIYDALRMGLETKAKYLGQFQFKLELHKFRLSVRG